MIFLILGKWLKSIKKFVFVKTTFSEIERSFMKKLLSMVLLVIVLLTLVSCQEIPLQDQTPVQKERTKYVPPNGIETREEP